MSPLLNPSVDWLWSAYPGQVAFNAGAGFARGRGFSERAP